MTALQSTILWALLAAAVFSLDFTSSPTTQKLPSTEPELTCMCLPCTGNYDFLSVHTQNHFCQAATVIQGRVTQKESRSSPEGIWLTKEHTDHFQRGFPPAHYKLTVKVIAIYSDQADTKVSPGDKIIVRYAKYPWCAPCQTLVENFHDEAWTDRDMKRGEKYVFFLPLLKEGYGNKLESALEQCSRVWRYSKRGKVIEGWVPLTQRYILTLTKCDKCRVSGCFQNKCVKVEDDKPCDDPDAKYRFKEKSCPAIINQGLCYYHEGTDSCRWTSITDDGYRSRKVIEHCLAEEE